MCWIKGLILSASNSSTKDKRPHCDQSLVVRDDLKIIERLKKDLTRLNDSPLVDWLDQGNELSELIAVFTEKLSCFEARLNDVISGKCNCATKTPEASVRNLKPRSDPRYVDFKFLAFVPFPSEALRRRLAGSSECEVDDALLEDVKGTTLWCAVASNETDYRERVKTLGKGDSIMLIGKAPEEFHNVVVNGSRSAILSMLDELRNLKRQINVVSNASMDILKDKSLEFRRL